MSELEIKVVPWHFVQYSLPIERFFALYCGYHFYNYVCFLKCDNSIDILVFEEKSLVVKFRSRVKLRNCPNLSKVQIVGNKNDILMLDSSENLYKFSNETSKNFYELNEYEEYKFDLFHELNLRKVFGIAACQSGFACLGLCENGQKILKVFEIDTLPDFVDCTFNDIRITQSNAYYLNTIVDYNGCQSLIISDKLNGKTYLCSKETHVSVTHYSNLQLISAISVISENCYLLCFENGKLVIYNFSYPTSDQILYLTKKIVCIKKCLCNDRCLLWSNGTNLYHTEINFDAGNTRMTHFKIKHNITGIINFVKVNNIIVASTVNGVCYTICKSENTRLELVQSPSEFLSQIYKESLTIKKCQNFLKTASEYLKLKEVIQNNNINMELSLEENYLSLKNKSEVTFKKEFWKIKLKMFLEGCDLVKMVMLEADLVKGMVMKIQNPFDNEGVVKVYILGEFEWEMFCFFIGVVGKEANLKKKIILKRI